MSRRRGPSKPSHVISGQQAGTFLAEMGTAMAPGSGLLDAGGQYYSPTQGGRMPGLIDNVREGDYGTAALQGLGLLGDALQFGGPVGLAAGAIAKAPKGIARGVKAARTVGKADDAIDMSQQARLARAQEMGFEGGYYKGAWPYDWTKETADFPGPELEYFQRTSPFPAFGGADGDVSGIAAFLTRDPEVANHFASAQRGAVYPLRYRAGSEFVIDAAGKKAGEVQFGEAGKAFRDVIRSGKYDTIRIINTADEGEVIVALKPENIRSEFAAFSSPSAKGLLE